MPGWASIPGREAALPSARRHWWKLREDNLLDVRICDLGLRLETTPLAALVDRLHGELERKGLAFRPHTWLGTEWFSPDGIPGIAIPFYLAHPRLRKLEKKMMLQVEGGTERECMKLLRHEAGHAICTAFRLHYKPSWRAMFGRFGAPYPEAYTPKPNSQDFVLHLEGWYAQAHPAEDFAETFAVWLKPNSRWRTEYADWPALRKLEYVDDLMIDLEGERAKVRSREHSEPIREVRTTLREYYEEKRGRYASDTPTYYDRDLRKLFSSERRYRHRPRASKFLRLHRKQLRESVGEWTGGNLYAIDVVIQEMIDRCRELRLHLRESESITRSRLALMITVQTMKSVVRGPRRSIAL